MIDRETLLRDIDSYHSLFLALPLDDRGQKAFAGMSQGVQRLDPPMTYQRAETVHVTLRFFDRIDPSLFLDYLKKWEEISKKIVPFKIDVSGHDFFGRPGERKVLWLKVEPVEPLRRINDWLQKEWPEERPFIPHVTLGRIKNQKQFDVFEPTVKEALQAVDFMSEINRLRLYGARDGERQIPLVDFTFASPPRSG